VEPRTSAAVNVTVTGAASPSGLPAGQTAEDIGSPAVAGRATYASPGTYTIDGAGQDIWDASDQFQFVYQSMTGDMEVIARVASLTNPDPWSKAGVMIRETLAANSRHAMAIISPGNGYSFQRRTLTGGVSEHTTTGAGTGTAPGWVRLVRTGSQIQAYRSADGATWTQIGSATVTMNATVFVGLAVTSHNATTAARAVIDNFRAQGVTGNSAPSVTLTGPANGATFAAPATINLTANASDPENQLSRVEFYSGTTLLGTDTTAPYSFSWGSVPAGTYSLTAKAYDTGGASATSSAVTVTVGSANAPPTATLTSPSSGTTFAAPATINLAANASDPENQLARVEFLSGTTVLGTDTTAPYSFSWGNVPAGTYSLTAKAYDTAGAVATSAAVNVTVTATTGGLPTGQTAEDIGSPAVAGRATYASPGTYTIDGAGQDIWDTSDQFQFVYQSMTGDMEVIARVASLTNPDPWSKAGVMIRETLAANSRHAMAIISPGNGYSFQRRTLTGGNQRAHDDRCRHGHGARVGASGSNRQSDPGLQVCRWRDLDADRVGDRYDERDGLRGAGRHQPQRHDGRTSGHRQLPCSGRHWKQRPFGHSHRTGQRRDIRGPRHHQPDGERVRSRESVVTSRVLLGHDAAGNGHDGALLVLLGQCGGGHVFADGEGLRHRRRQRDLFRRGPSPSPGRRRDHPRRWCSRPRQTTRPT
jgi:regulation of enolase protein 1 (concanavalin A-like superfamily)